MSNIELLDQLKPIVSESLYVELDECLQVQGGGSATSIGSLEGKNQWLIDNADRIEKTSADFRGLLVSEQMRLQGGALLKFNQLVYPVVPEIKLDWPLIKHKRYVSDSELNDLLFDYLSDDIIRSKIDIKKFMQSMIVDMIKLSKEDQVVLKRYLSIIELFQSKDTSKCVASIVNENLMHDPAVNVNRQIIIDILSAPNCLEILSWLVLVAEDLNAEGYQLFEYSLM
ncbi:hypothetical protein MMH89_02190 [Candidatus Comchoanobacter bicostacola]|uniref:Uncharacterized protein n=1 Tax=Candidatus Comchoanobacter bicostacola TaxID=2919598 RepID=A0ABY5DMX5_9GAMM|nr:hypothetical protein [Candidatus Comchoanobacter bicostacola]UTC24957.1 hypothetical protein MMH89_02190 [Candidatus Comchoanobacter bicostacola]